MKKIILLLLVSTLFASCEKDLDPMTEAIQKNWCGAYFPVSAFRPDRGRIDVSRIDLPSEIVVIRMDPFRDSSIVILEHYDLHLRDTIPYESWQLADPTKTKDSLDHHWIARWELRGDTLCAYSYSWRDVVSSTPYFYWIKSTALDRIHLY